MLLTSAIGYRDEDKGPTNTFWRHSKEKDASLSRKKKTLIKSLNTLKHKDRTVDKTRR